jgi:hypothetical protein
MNCSTCGMKLELVFENDADVADIDQFDNVLILRSEGGYGMFTDYFDEPAPVFYLCHECAHLFCKIFDPDKKLIDPYLSHSHKEGTVEISHEGWDREFREREA